ncbi:MAG: PEP-CTERM sorting domain-containing protein [Myxococcota bacterium]
MISSPDPTRRRLPRWRTPWLAILGLVCGALTPPSAPATTLPVVYHSPADDGARPSAPTVFPSGATFVVHLYMDESSGGVQASASDVCESGGGTERCGWDLVVEGVGDVDFVSFVGVGDVVFGLSPAPAPRLRMNGGAPISGELGVVKLGDLEVATSGEGSVELIEGVVADAALARVVLAASPVVVVVVPEPDAIAMLGVGLTSLLARRRRRRERIAAIAGRRADGPSRIGIACVAMIGSVVVAPSYAGAQSLCDPGDLNDDGQVDILDSTVLRRSLAELSPGIAPSCVPPDSSAACRSGRRIGYPGTGNTCNFATSPGAPALPGIALSEKNYAELFTGTGYDAPFPGASTAKACGACLEVFGPSGSAIGIVREVADIGSVGDHGKPNTPHLSFALADAIGVPYGLGGPITFRVVPCPVTGNLQVRRMSFASTGFLSFVVYNGVDAIAQVEFREALPGQPWGTLTQTWTNRWELLNAPTVYPFQQSSTQVELRVTSLRGDVVVTQPIPLPSFTSAFEAYFDAGVQLPTRAAPGGTCDYVPSCGDGYVDSGAGETCEPLFSSAVCSDLGFSNAAPAPCDPDRCQPLAWDCVP